MKNEPNGERVFTAFNDVIHESTKNLIVIGIVIMTTILFIVGSLLLLPSIFRGTFIVTLQSIVSSSRNNTEQCIITGNFANQLNVNSSSTMCNDHNACTIDLECKKSTIKYCKWLPFSPNDAIDCNAL